MSIVPTEEELKLELESDYKTYLVNFIYKGLENIFPSVGFENQLIVISELMFKAVEADENSVTAEYFKKIISYTNSLLYSLLVDTNKNARIRYYKLVNDLYEESLQEVLFYFTHKDLQYNYRHKNLFSDLE